jgi:hypothetical protein
MNVFQRIWVVVVSTLAAYIVGVFYEFFRPALSSATANGALAPWFSPGDYRYVLSWLFAFAGCIAAVFAVGMAAPPAVKRASRSPEQGAGVTAKPIVKSADKGQSKTQTADVPGMPGFDFDKAKAEIRSAASSDAGSAPLPGGAIAAIPDQPVSSGPGAVTEPPKEPQA